MYSQTRMDITDVFFTGLHVDPFLPNRSFIHLNSLELNHEC